MAEVRAVAKYIRMSPHKVRLVIDLVRGKDVEDALTLLRFTPKAAAKPVAKVIASAAANAEENLGLARDELFISRIWADEGPTL
ncbi:MAG: 50S ribosomal protein L22, partial [Chloroflexi bacterium]|nr:50S ribosomal protein L22 [Chloroflexota bacterium]